LASLVSLPLAASTSYAKSIGRFVHQDILGANNSERCARPKRIYRCPAVPHTVFIGRGGHNVPERTVTARPPIFLKEGRIHIITNPVARVVLSAVLGQTYPLIVFIIQPVDLELIVRISRIKISAKH
jgi:hypothetical protein